MEILHNQQHYEALRKRYPLFVYESFSFVADSEGLKVQFVFSVNDEYFFRPEIFIPSHVALAAKVSEGLLASLVFHIGMVEMISYWKAFCSPRILVKPYMLSGPQQQWWKKLFRHGLGEFFYTNGIEIPGEELLEFEFADGAEELPRFHTPVLAQQVLIPVGGGKDSVVSLELLKQFSERNLALVVNPRGATSEVLDAAGFSEDQHIGIQRSIDPLLLELNTRGFLNGHTPFSALLAFVSSLCACMAGVRYIALSNESSANEPSIPGTIINHQYSKSLEFEQDFRAYFAAHIFAGLEYFSLLRPLNELQIAALFAGFKPYHPVFKSCNAGSKTDVWCGQCPKCLFTYIILSPFLKQQLLQEIFGKDLFNDARLIPVLDQLTGTAANKPFECVGTLDEVNISLVRTVKQRLQQQAAPPGVLLDHYLQGPAYLKYRDQDFADRLKAWHEPHFLDRHFEELLQNALKTI